jgi:endonuclease III
MNHQTIRDVLLARGTVPFDQPRQFIHFARNDDGDALLNDLDHYPHAFVLGCVMDRQILAEKAWIIPYEIKRRLNTFEFADLKQLSLEEAHHVISQPTPLHRFPTIMARFLYLAIQRIAERYHDNASNIWANSPSSATVVGRFRQFDGIGPKIATMAANSLARDFKVPLHDKYSIDISTDVHVQRVFKRLGLVQANASLEDIISTARDMNPDYPGIFDLPTWEIGHTWCSPRNPRCDECYMKEICPRIIWQ